MPSMESNTELAELRTNFIRHFLDQPDPQGSQRPLFQLETDSSQRIKLSTNPSLVSEVDNLRKRIIHPFRIRGTSGQFMNQAREADQISAKKVSDWWEPDVGSIATYGVPTYCSGLSSEDFLYLLQFTTTAALKYAFSHANWEFLDITDSFEDNLKRTKDNFAFQTNDPRLRLDDTVEVVICYEDASSLRQSSTQHLKKVLPINGSFVFPYDGYVLDPHNYERITYWDQKLAPFKEKSFSPVEPSAEYSPLYLRFPKQRTLELLDQLENLGSSQRRFVEKMTTISTYTYPRVKDAVLHLLGEEATFQLIKILHNWEHDNEPTIQFTYS